MNEFSSLGDPVHPDELALITAYTEHQTTTAAALAEARAAVEGETKALRAEVKALGEAKAAVHRELAAAKEENAKLRKQIRAAELELSRLRPPERLRPMEEMGAPALEWNGGVLPGDADWYDAGAGCSNAAVEAEYRCRALMKAEGLDRQTAWLRTMNDTALRQQLLDEATTSVKKRLTTTKHCARVLPAKEAK